MALEEFKRIYATHEPQPLPQPALADTLENLAREGEGLFYHGVIGQRIAELCRREGIATSLYYSWSKEFLEAGKKRLSGDTERQATSSEVRDLCRDMSDLKEALADVLLENRLLKKSMIDDGDAQE